MSLRHASQFTEPYQRPEIDSEVPSYPVAKRNCILRFLRHVRSNHPINIHSTVHHFLVIQLKSGVAHKLRYFITVLCGKELTLLGKHAVSLKITIRAEVCGNIKGVVNMLKCTAGLVSAVCPAGKVGIKNPVSLFSRECTHMIQQLREG